MPEDPVVLMRRVAERMDPPLDAFERTARRKTALRRRNSVLSAFVALAVFASGLALLVRAFAGPKQAVVSGPTVPPPRGVAPRGIGAVETVRAFGSDVAVALTDRAVIRTSDGGLHWTTITPPGFGRFASSGLFFLDARRGWIVSLPIDKDGTFSVFRTADGGRTWNRASVHLPPRLDYDTFAPGHAQAPEFGFFDPLHGWLHLPVAPAPLFGTSDGGATWTAGPVIDAGSDSVQAITLTSPTEGWAVREHDLALSRSTDLPVQSLYRTVDGGATWQHVELPDPPITFPNQSHGPAVELGLPAFFGPSQGVVAAWTGKGEATAMFAYVTHDGGKTWSATAPIPIRQGAGSPIFVPALVSATTWFVGSTSGELAVTRDGGRSWSMRSVTSIRPYRYAAALHFPSARDGWAMGCEGWSGGLASPTVCNGRSALYRTTDGGRSWTLMLTNFPTARR